MSPVDIAFFRKRSDEFSFKASKLNTRLTLYSLFRVIAFISFIIIAIVAANNTNLTLLIGASVIFAIVFVFLVKGHTNLKYRKNHFLHLSEINQDEISRIKGKLDHFDEGREFIEEGHPYHVDLDIFGRNSLFQLLNRTTTYEGRKTLAGWISQKTSSREIYSRQEAIKELAGDIDWLQAFQATGMHTQSKTDGNVFFNWLDENNLIHSNWFFRIVRFAGPLFLLSLTGLGVFSIIPVSSFLAGFIINGIVLITIRNKIDHIHKCTFESIRSLQSCEALIGFIGKRKFYAEKLLYIRDIFSGHDHEASRIIGNLKRIFQNLDNRGNMMYQLFNSIFLLDIHFTIAAEKWKIKQPENIRHWFKMVGETEALNSLAAFSFSNPDYTYPEINSTPHSISFSETGHPLIPYSERVLNSFTLTGGGHIALITGSNMAGKTTFLRTIGINTVLAMAGAPVCAEKAGISIARVFTSMRTQDNLEENMSSFYAELNRIKQLLDMLNEKDPILFLLDEILKGTNSHDRHLGAKSLVKQLSEKNAIGLISTHDLELAKGTIQGSAVKNYSFESSIAGEEIIFDYKLQEGVSRTFNASKLMEKIGIQLLGK